MLSAARGTEVMAPMATMPGGAAGSGGHSGAKQSQAAHDACGTGCCAPTDASYFVQEDFRGDMDGDSCITLELSISTSCNVKACLWREFEMKTQQIVSKSSSVIGISVNTTQEQLDNVILSCSKPSKRTAPEDTLQFGVPRETVDPNYQLVDPIELMAIDAMALSYPKYYRCKKVDGRLAIELTRCGTVEARPTLQPTDALGLLFHHWIGLAEGQVAKNAGDPPAGGKKKGKAKRSLNIVVPNCFNSAVRAKLVAAAMRAGAAVKNIFSRGLAAVAGSLHRDKGTSSPLYAALMAHAESRKDKDRTFALPSPLTLTPPAAAALPKDKRADKTSPKEKAAEPLSVLYLEVSDAFVELSLISCEGGRGGQEGSNRMGFDRLVSFAHIGLQLDESEDMWISGAIVELVQDLLIRAGDFDKAKVSTVLCRCMDSTLDDLLRFLEDPNHGGVSTAPGKAYGDVGMPLSPSASVAPSPKNSPYRGGRAGSLTLGPVVVQLVPADVVRGGCVLSAAELQSSKLFVHEGSENSFNVSHYLAIGEDDSGGTYGVVVTDTNLPEKKSDKNDNRVGNRERTASGHKIAIDEKPTEVMARHNRLAKPNVGPPLRQAAVAKLQYEREFRYTKSKLLYREDPSDATSLTGGARLRLLQQEVVNPHVSGTGVHTIWRLVEEVSPLLGVSQEGGAALVDRGKVTIALQPATGCAALAVDRGEAVLDTRQSIWATLKLILFLVCIGLCFAGYRAYGQYVENRDRQEIVDWITNFYQHNAPDKLSDPQFAQKMADKYADKMFVFWRQLLKTYKVEWEPPACIVDEL